MRIWSRMTPPPNLSVWVLMYWLAGSDEQRIDGIRHFGGEAGVERRHEDDVVQIAGAGGIERAPSARRADPVLMTTGPLMPAAPIVDMEAGEEVRGASKPV